MNDLTLSHINNNRRLLRTINENRAATAVQDSTGHYDETDTAIVEAIISGDYEQTINESVESAKVNIGDHKVDVQVADITLVKLPGRKPRMGYNENDFGKFKVVTFDGNATAYAAPSKKDKGKLVVWSLSGKILPFVYRGVTALARNLPYHLIINQVIADRKAA